VLTQLAVAKGDEKKDPKLFPPGRYDEHGQQVPPFSIIIAIILLSQSWLSYALYYRWTFGTRIRGCSSSTR
jgi:hypothetical protein